MSQDFIPGVYNFCDRWCERCPLTARCRVFAFEEQRKRGDDYFHAFWKLFDDQVTHSLENWSDDVSDDESDSDDESFSPPELQTWNSAGEFELRATNPLVSLGTDYGDKVHKWLSQWEENEILSEQCRPQLALPETIGLDEAFEILRWYVHQIGIKLDRAMREDRDLFGDIEETGEENVYSDDFRHALEKARRQDRDGSAKIALIGIERSLGAWTILRDHFSDHNQNILSFQRILARLRRMLDEQIPNARTFQRPGFDYEV
jgi:hypothetical protein